MSTPHWAFDPEKLEAFVLHRVDEIERTEQANHLEQCDECRLRVQKEEELIAGIRQFGRIETKRQLRMLIRQNLSNRFEWTHVASIAAAVIIMLVAVFVIRWSSDFEKSKIRTREMVLKESEPSQRSIWITGRVITQNRTFHGRLSDRTSSFIIEHGSTSQNVSIRCFKLSELPFAMINIDKSIIQTMLEQTPSGLQLNLYTDSIKGPFVTGIETVSLDSIIVYLQGRQIAYHIPGGWGS